jgi:hypothetical protein
VGAVLGSLRKVQRLDAAIDLLTLSSARLKGLKDVIFSGPDEAIGAALANLRFARVRFLEARSDHGKMKKTSLVSGKVLCKFRQA